MVCATYVSGIWTSVDDQLDILQTYLVKSGPTRLSASSAAAESSVKFYEISRKEDLSPDQ